MKHAFVFPGQGAQFAGMGKTHYDNSSFAKKIFEQANDILGFRISDVMFNGTEDDLKQTKITQPAIFLHQLIYKTHLHTPAGRLLLLCILPRNLLSVLKPLHQFPHLP